MTTTQTNGQAIKDAVTKAIQDLLGDNPYSEDQVKALKEFGFSNAKNITDFNDHQKSSEVAKAYRLKYPDSKFISAGQMSRLEDKFKLDTFYLVGFDREIPESVIKDMTSFTIESGDVEPVSVARQERGSKLFPSYPYTTGGWVDRGTKDGLYSTNFFPSGIVSLIRSQINPEVVGITAGCGSGKTESFFKYYGLVEDELEKKKKAHADQLLLSLSEVNKDFPFKIEIYANEEVSDGGELAFAMVVLSVKGGYMIISDWGYEVANT